MVQFLPNTKMKITLLAKIVKLSYSIKNILTEKKETLQIKYFLTF